MKSGLERVAEELMGRRKWKHYQDVLTRQQLNLPSVDEDDLLNSAAAAVASSVASNAVPLTPSLVAAVGGNLLDQKGATTIVRNGHYQQDDELESKVASSNNQQVAAAAATTAVPASDKQVDHHHQEAATAKQNHFNETDTRPATATATPPPSQQPSSNAATATVGTGSVTHLNSSSNSNPHHLHNQLHLLHHQQQAVETKKEKSDVCLQDPQETGEDSSSTSTTTTTTTFASTTSREELLHLATGDKTAAAAVHSISSPALSSSSATTTTTTALLSPATAASTVAELDERTKELVGKLAIKQEPAENQNNSSAVAAPEQQSKLIRQENCNSLLNSKIIINNNNNSSSATNNNNNNNNNISSSELDGSTPDGEIAVGGTSHKQLLQSPRQPPTPVDWKPQDKCYFCVDGKLLTVNEAGELVPESGGPAGVVPKAEVDLNQPTINESDSDSSDSSEPDLRAVLGRSVADSTKSLAALLGSTSGVPQSMMESVAKIAAAASLQAPSLAQFYNPLWYTQLQQMSPSEGVDPPPAVSPLVKAERTGLGPGGEQPLDLSAKPGTSGINPGLMMSMMDPKNIYKAKPRLSPIGGRRTYTEEELQNALQDILNGKLGTRRAAVLYGIPRSTLRNKVYKLMMEHKRELFHNLTLARELADDDDDKDSIEDEPKDEINQQAFTDTYLDLFRKQVTTGGSRSKQEPSSAPSTPPQHRPTPEPPMLKPIQLQAAQPALPPQSSPIAAAAATSLLDPSLLLQLQSLLIAGGIPALANNAAHSKNPEEAAAAQAALAALPELLKKVIQQQELITEQIKKVATGDPRPSTAITPTLNNGPQIDPRLLPYLQAHQQQQQQQQLQSKQPRTASGTPETTTSSMDLNDGGSDDSQVILKIPSYKPVPGSGPIPASAAALLAASKNGDHQSLSTPSPPTGVPNVRDLSSLVSGSLGGPGPSPNSSSISSGSSRPVHRASPQQAPPQTAKQASNHLPVISPLRPRSTSQSPPSLLGSKSMMAFNDIIAERISKNFQQQQQADMLKQQMESMEYKRPTISVIKNLGGTDISRFGSNPNITQIGSSQLGGGTGTGGKGTRPKRGKYRNYDRDSLVEAVKAVQRGEMSVHRAGSYYGVPHSTLEYKVKERHLMRPRKREPKPQPGLDGIKSEFAGASSSSVMRSMDKSKSQSLGSSSSKTQQQQQQQQQLKNQFPGTSPNGGLKMPMFDPAMASQLPYTSPFLWPHPTAAFTGLPMDFTRQTAGAGAGSAGNSADSIFSSPMMQRFQEQQQQASKVPPTLSNSGVTAKTTRELAESIYDGTSTNGSLLDDIIRHSLEKKPGEMPHGALFDQLMKTNNLRTSSSSSSSIAASEEASAALLAKVGTKRSAASPLNFLSDNIKRERASPDASSPSSSGSSKPSSLPVGLAAFSDHHLQQQQQLHLQQQQQQRHLNTSSDSLLDSHRAELLAKGNLAVENLIKLREDLTSMSVAHHQRTPMEDQHNGAGLPEGGAQHGKDGSTGSEQQQQHHHHHQQILSRRLVAKLPTDDSS